MWTKGPERPFFRVPIGKVENEKGRPKPPLDLCVCRGNPTKGQGLSLERYISATAEKTTYSAEYLINIYFRATFLRCIRFNPTPSRRSGRENNPSASFVPLTI